MDGRGTQRRRTFTVLVAVGAVTASVVMLGATIGAGVFPSAQASVIAPSGIGPCAPSSTTDGGDTVLTFSTVGACTWTVPADVRGAEVLVVGGGGGGGADNGGGGGAGGLVHLVCEPLTPSTVLEVTVGAGGAGSTSSFAPAANGGQSAFATTIAVGGGGGGSIDNTPGLDGGSSGGRAASRAGGGEAATPTSTPAQGHDGGSTLLGGGFGGAGGGGAGAVGGDGGGGVGGNGGVGIELSITGTATHYAGGGGGGGNASTPGTGGSGGGGTGARIGTDTPDAGTDGLGGGGGGAGGAVAGGVGASGGSGVVIVRALAGEDCGAPIPPVFLVPADLPVATVGSVYDVGLDATTGANVAIAGCVVTGSFPPGLELVAVVDGALGTFSCGRLTGTPTEPGTHSFMATITYSPEFAAGSVPAATAEVAQSFTLVVEPSTSPRFTG